MTKIERLTIWPFDQQQVVDNYNKINELIDKVNQQEEQIKALQKIVAGDQLAKEINEWLDRVYWTTKEQEEDLLVPDEVEFVEYWSNGSISWLLFSNQQILTFSTYESCLFVKKYTEKYRRLRCKLVPCKLEDVEVGEWIVCRDDNDKVDLSEIDRYWLVIGEYWLKARINTDDWITTRKRKYNRQNYYKVQPIE